MSKCKYENIQSLEIAIQNYFDNESRPTPRHFRAIGLGISKQTLCNWKKSKPEYFYLIKTAEDLIMAKMEQLFAYGGKEFYNIALTLRAYDKEQYAPELTQHQKEEVKPIQLVQYKPQATKGKQSSRKITLIGKPK